MRERDAQTVELLQRWHGGDRPALEELLARHLDPLHRHVRAKLDRELGHLRRDQDSMDLVQAAAIRVLEYTPAFIPRDGAQFQKLLQKIVLNDVLNQLRSPRLKRRETDRSRYGDSVLDLRTNSQSSVTPDLGAEKIERAELTRAWARMALEFLSDEQDRRLVLLAAVEERSWEEIGQELGLGPDAARMRYRRLLPKIANHVRLLKEGRVEALLTDSA